MGEVDKCEQCWWAIWDYCGVVACCNSGDCPTPEEFEEHRKAMEMDRDID